MSDGTRTILHCDLDAFFASVEQRDDPSLRGRPVLVGGIQARGVVAAASYEARRFGCRSAMPTRQALRLCPDAVVLPARGAQYADVSRSFMRILESVSPLVEGLSLDEAFVDVTGSQRLLGDGRAIAEKIRANTQDELGLVVSVGVAPNKFVAKIASDLEKPDALVVFEEEGLAERLASLSIERMWGIGPRSVDSFRAQGFTSFGDLQRIDPDELEARFGTSARRFHALACGRDDRPVVPERSAKSLGQERTFSRNITDIEAVQDILLGEVEQVAERLRRSGRHARTITLKIRFGDFETITRSRTLKEATDVTRIFWQEASALLEKWASTSFQPVRLLGFSVGGFENEVQPSLFEDEESGRAAQVDAVTDAIQARFGEQSISRARSIRRGGE